MLAIEALTAARALDLLAPLKTSPALEAVRGRIREVSPPIDRTGRFTVISPPSKGCCGAVSRRIYRYPGNSVEAHAII